MDNTVGRSLVILTRPYRLVIDRLNNKVEERKLGYTVKLKLEKTMEFY